MAIAPARSGGEGGDDGAGGGPLNRKRYKPRQADIDVSLAKGEKTQEAEMVKAAKAFAEDMEPWQWGEYKKGWAGPNWDKKKNDFIWSNIPGKHPDFPLAKQIAGKKERQHRTSSSTRLQNSAADVFAKGGIPGMNVLFGMIGVAGKTSASASLLSLTGLTKTQTKYLPGKAKFNAEFEGFQKASDLVGDELKKANEILWKYEVDDIAKLTKEQEHLVVHEVKTGEKIQAKASVLKKNAKNKEFADDQGKGAELETKVTAQADEAAEAKKKLEQANKDQSALRQAEADRLANQYVDESTALSPQELSARGKKVTRQTKPFEGVASKRRAGEFQDAVDQDFGLDEAVRARIAGESTPKVVPKKSASQIIEPEPAPAPQGRRRNDNVVVDGVEMTPDQADEMLRSVGGTPGLGASSRPKTGQVQHQAMNQKARQDAAAGLKFQQESGFLRELKAVTQRELADDKTIDGLLDQATRRSKRPKKGTSWENLEDWITERTEVIATIRAKLKDFPNADPDKINKVQDALARLQRKVIPGIKAEVAPFREAANKAAKIKGGERAEDVRFFNKLTKEEKKAIRLAMDNDMDKVFEHVRKIRMPEKLTQPKMKPDLLSGSPTPASELGAPPKPKAAPSERTSLRQAAANQLGPDSALEKVGAVVGRGAKKAAGGGLGVAKAGLGGALKRPTLATIGATGAAGAGVYAYDENQKAKEAELKAQQEAQYWQKVSDDEERNFAQATLDSAQPLREDAAVYAKSVEGDWWNQPYKQWTPEFDANPAAKEHWDGYLKRPENRAEMKNYANYNKAQKNQFLEDNAKSYRGKFANSAKAREMFRSKLGDYPKDPPRPKEAWVPTQAESGYTKINSPKVQR